MHCSQPLYGTGFLSHFGPNYPCNFGFPQVQPTSLCPDIIGEGEVVSVVFPDGSVHLYFIPLNKRFPSCNIHANPNYTPFSNTIGAYYVRGISNPIASALFSQQCQKMCTAPYSRPCYIADCNENIPSSGFQLKFHNDSWTSTTDLHYFFPSLRQCNWFPSMQPKGCASVQVDFPVKESAIFRQQAVCAKPCSGLQNDEKFSECESADECPERKQKQASKKNRKQKRVTLGKRRSSAVCQCREARTTDKSIATVADQSSGCEADERDTQTSRSYSCCCGNTTEETNRSNDQAELWIPKTAFSGKGLEKISSSRIIGIYETHSTPSCSCSGTE